MLESKIITELRNEIMRYTDQAAEMLADLVSIPSISGEENPVQQRAAEIFGQLQGHCELIPMKEDLRSDPDHASGIKVPYDGRVQTRYVSPDAGKGKSLILCAHLDVVGPGDWAEAFEPRLENGMLYGRGAVDDKASVVSAFLALQAMQQLGITPKGRIEVHLTNEEEVGMAGALAFVRGGFMADGVLVLEPTDHNIYIANRGCLQFRMEITGKQAHLGRKREGVSAIEKAASIITALVEYEDRLIAEGKGYPLFDKFEFPGQVNVGLINGGDFFSTVPDLVTMEGGIGFLPSRKMEQVQRELAEVVDGLNDPWLKDNCRLIFDGLKNEPFQMPLEHPFTNALKDTLRQLERPQPEVSGMMATCDARYYYNQGGMPSIIYGGKSFGLTHSKGEHAEIKDVLETALDYAVFALNWTGTPEMG